MNFVAHLRTTAAKRLSGLHSPIRIVVLLAAVVLIALLLFWLFNELFYFWIAKSYVDEVSQAYDINKGFTKALTWTSFAALVVFGGWIISFSKRKRMIGYTGIVALLVGHGAVLGMRDTHFTTDGKTAKCYVLLRDGIKILNHVGIDPDSGRECRQLTPKMVEFYNAYKDGRRAKQIKTDETPAFFESASGEPIVWYSKTETGRIELFDLMGWDPQTGEELQPIDRKTINEWKNQPKEIRRAPQRVNPEKFPFFDPTTGRPQVWFWLTDSGNYEFYDGPGFDQLSGGALKVISNAEITAWRRQLAAKKQAEEAAAAAKKQADDAAAAAKKQADDEAAAAKKKSDEQAAEAKRAADSELQKQQQAGNDCDRLATNSTDANRNRNVEGVSYELLLTQIDAAIDACSNAVQQWPNELRYQFQLGRAYQKKDWKKASVIFSRLVKLEYPAAYDNLGCIYRDNLKDRAAAIDLFQRGANHNDADAMVDLADNVGNDAIARLNLLKRAAELGHVGAQRAFPIELQKAQEAQAQVQQQQENNRRAMEVFGHILDGALRR